MKKINVKSIVVIGRRWRHRGPGNTYHSMTALIDGKPVVRVDFCYGYGNQYEWTALQQLADNGFLPGLNHYPNGNSESLWQYCERNKINYHAEVADVNTRKDL